MKLEDRTTCSRYPGLVGYIIEGPSSKDMIVVVVGPKGIYAFDLEAVKKFKRADWISWPHVFEFYERFMYE